MVDLSMNVNRLYYSNSDGHQQRILRDFVNLFCNNFNLELSSPQSKVFFEKFRIPNERELYGIFVKSCLKFQGDVGFIATELQVGREGSSVGRVDFLLCYKDVHFLIEFKVARINIAKDISTLSNIPKVLQPWESACDQMKRLNIEQIESDLNYKYIRLPIVVYLYVSNKDEDLVNDIASAVSIKHKKLIEAIDDRLLPKVTLEYTSPFDNSWRCHKRRSTSKIEGATTWLYGFSVLATEIIVE
ncbi:hypothetical protein L5M43_05590 [Shewanella sp. SW36]|uniref:hypothetical protein n=1 Tax=unclassified Shewanella TaxID=196818 RepID=UPI0021DA40A3|nr:MULTISPECIES: hypothetical protein [unclassified Shewanella]MCU7974748.1 hypothetical protein [Shewanella sp. SW36]MCU7990137.1 hypothetical protein [Shewanella sp. SW1]MCU8052067.1 hypothetical protein [Shewanella sp. SM43]